MERETERYRVIISEKEGEGERERVCMYTSMYDERESDGTRAVQILSPVRALV